jgi:voltage-gated potassium channel
VVAVPRSRPFARRFLAHLTLRRAIAGILAVALTFTLGAAAIMRIADPESFGDYGSACWWAVQTVTTVGYGDNVPKTDAGKLVAAFVMLFGIALVPAITSLVVAIFINQQIREMAQSGDGGEDPRIEP